MTPFDFSCPTRIAFGPGRVSELGALAALIAPNTRVLVASDPGVIAAGHTQRGIESLQAAGHTTLLFDGIQENPTTDNVDAGVAVAQEFDPQILVGLGGGSSMDCTKGINFIHSCGGRMQDYRGVGKATADLLPMIAVPTTAGTGSEAQSFALISDAETHVKMACGDKRAAFSTAVLDPELTLTQPPMVTALTGIDAVAHAVETLVTAKRNPISQAFTREAWRALVSGIRVFEEPDNLEARADMQLGACFAGLAIENSMLGAAHALANPLTANFGVPHGQAVGVMLPHVVRYNGANCQDCAEAYKLLAGPLTGGDGSPSDSVAAAATLLEELCRRAGLKTTLSDLQIPADSLPRLAKEALPQWTVSFNPVPLDAEALLSIYRAAL
ncbi:MAG: iron-containing alcohol dehydrogenase [Planctomycetota bacterium]